MTAPVVDQAVACGNCPPGAKCLPASHNMEHLGAAGWKYCGCRVHRLCGEYAPAVEPTPEAADAPTEPPTDQPDPPATTADSPTDTTAQPLGQLLASHRVWYCPRCLNGRELPRRCCDVELIRGRLTIRREP